MESREYQSQAPRTSALDVDAATARFEAAHNALMAGVLDVVGSTQRLERLKKYVFYGVGDGPAWRPQGKLAADVTKAFEDHFDLLHAAVGIATESGELLDGVYASLFNDDNGSGVDVVNICEELGDLMWYQALAAQELRLPFETIWAANLAKLKKRYAGGAFTQAEAASRDTDAEMKAVTAAMQAPSDFGVFSESYVEKIRSMRKRFGATPSAADALAEPVAPAESPKPQVAIPAITWAKKLGLADFCLGGLNLNFGDVVRSTRPFGADYLEGRLVSVDSSGEGHVLGLAGLESPGGDGAALSPSTDFILYIRYEPGAWQVVPSTEAALPQAIDLEDLRSLVKSAEVPAEALVEGAQPSTPGAQTCPQCGAAEVEADTPRTVYACGSSDYDRRPHTFTSTHVPATISSEKGDNEGQSTQDVRPAGMTAVPGTPYAVFDVTLWPDANALAPGYAWQDFFPLGDSTRDKIREYMPSGKRFHVGVLKGVGVDQPK